MTAVLAVVFYWVLNMNIAASVTGGVVCLFRLFRPLPRRSVAWLWAAPYFRMAAPVGLASDFSLMRLLWLLADKTATVWQPRSVPVPQAGSELPFFAMNTVAAAESYYPFTFRRNALWPVFGAAGWIWLAGTALLLAFFGAAYISGLRRVKRTAETENGVCAADFVKSPAVYGILRPRILLPGNTAPEARPYILLHERTHIRRRDNLRRLPAFALTAAHWFNPLAWLFLKLYLADLELACDEQAAAGLDAEGRKAYARALVNAAPAKTALASPFGGAGLRPRVERLLSYRRAAGVSLFFSALLCGAVLFCLVTNAG